jgi:hypothetical protein
LVVVWVGEWVVVWLGELGLGPEGRQVGVLMVGFVEGG